MEVQPQAYDHDGFPDTVVEAFDGQPWHYAYNHRYIQDHIPMTNQLQTLPIPRSRHRRQLNAVSASIHQSVRSPPSPATPEGRPCIMRKHAGGVGPPLSTPRAVDRGMPSEAQQGVIGTPGLLKKPTDGQLPAGLRIPGMSFSKDQRVTKAARAAHISRLQKRIPV
jgi:hypothetical protein